MLRVRHHSQQHYSTIFNPLTGFFARIEDSGHPEPFWSKQGPELLDISITNWCDNNCSVCYRNSHPNGHHMAMTDYEKILKQAAEIGVLQIALGGGNPNQHPDFCKMLEITRCVYSIVPSYTTNGKGLSPQVIDASVKFCGAVAVSAYPPFINASKAIETFSRIGVRINVHFVLDATSLDTALNWMKNPPSFLKKINAIIFLNYKPVGRGAWHNTLANNPLHKKFFETLSNATYPFKIGFDSCLVSALVNQPSFEQPFYDACEAARFSMFISESLHGFPCSFMEQISEGYLLNESNLLDIWQHGQTFREIRSELESPKCKNCDHLLACKGGCPVFPGINLCDEAQKNRPIIRNLK